VVEHHHIESIAVGDQQFAPIGGVVDRIERNLDPAEIHARIGPQHLVMVAGDQHHASAAVRHLEHPADHFVVGFGPVPALAQPPAIDDIADQIERLTFVRTQEIEQQLGVAAARAQVDVGNPDRAQFALGPEPARFGQIKPFG
jgi:hypothetical protein